MLQVVTEKKRKTRIHLQMLTNKIKVTSESCFYLNYLPQKYKFAQKVWENKYFHTHKNCLYE